MKMFHTQNQSNMRLQELPSVLSPHCHPHGNNMGALPPGGSPLHFRSAAAVLWPVPALVPGILLGADHGPPHPVPHWNVHALDPHRPYSGNQRTLHDGVRAHGLCWGCACAVAWDFVFRRVGWWRTVFLMWKGKQLFPDWLLCGYVLYEYLVSGCTLVLALTYAS